MILVAHVKDKLTKEQLILEKEYPTKAAFKADIKSNGYTIVNNYIFTKEEFEKLMNEDSEFTRWFEERLHKQRLNSKINNRIRADKKKYNI